MVVSPPPFLLWADLVTIVDTKQAQRGVQFCKGHGGCFHGLVPIGEMFWKMFDLAIL